MKCNQCNSTSIITVEHEIVCSKCGNILDTIQDNSYNSYIDHNTRTHQNELGSKDIPIKKNIMLKGKRQHLTQFNIICDILNLPDIVKSTAIKMFKKLLLKKLGTGKTAAFVILQSYINTGLKPLPEDRIIKVIRSKFNLKRYFDMRDAVYTVKPTAKDMGLVINEDITESYLIRKYIDPDDHVSAAKIINSLKHIKDKKRVKLTQEYLSNLG